MGEENQGRQGSGASPGVNPRGRKVMDQTVRSRTRFRALGIATIVAGAAITTLVPAAWSRGLREEPRMVSTQSPIGWTVVADAGVAANAPMTLAGSAIGAGEADAPRGKIKNVDKRPDNIGRILGGKKPSTNVGGEPTTPASTPDNPNSAHASQASPAASETSSVPTMQSSDTSAPTLAPHGNDVTNGSTVDTNALPAGVVSDVDPAANETKSDSDGSGESDDSSDTNTDSTTDDVGADWGAGDDLNTTDTNDDGDADLTPGTARSIPTNDSKPPVQRAIGNSDTHSGFVTASADSGTGQTRTVTDMDVLPLIPLSSKPAPMASGSQSTTPLTPAKPITPSAVTYTPAPMASTPEPMAPAPSMAPPAPPSLSSMAVAPNHAPVGSSSVETDTKFISSVKINPLTSNVITLTRSTSAVLELHGKVDRVEIANPSVATAYTTTPSRIVVVGRGLGTTELAIYMGDQERVLSISVEMDMRPLRDMIASVAPGAAVTPRNVNGTIVLTGTVPDSGTAERLAELAALYESGKVLNQLRVAGVQQTQLRCMVAEVNKVALRQLGVNWALGGSDLSRDVFMANNLNQLNPTQIGSSGVANVLTDQQIYSIFPAVNGGTSNFTLGFPRAELQFFINALRENQLFRVLAEPNLTAISGQTAMFLAGGEVPIPVTQGGAVAGSITIEYKEFGVRLHFTPTVVGGQLIRLHVMSEYSDAIPGATIAGGLPTFSFTTRRVESTVECGNGQTFAIAGLLSERVRAISSKIPALGDIPVLGALFSSVEYQKSNSELVILVTPELVQALDPQQVGPAPGALMTDPSDYELFGLGKLEGEENERPGMDVVPRNEQEPRTYPPAGGPEARARSRACNEKCGDDCDDKACKDGGAKACRNCGTSGCQGRCVGKTKICTGCGSRNCKGCDGKLIPMHGPTGTVNFDE